jgi:zinc and cadmium transporter
MTAFLLILYAGTALLASLAGGCLPSLIRLTHTRLQTALSFIAGLMLGMALLHLIPHAAEEAQSLNLAVAWVLGGFLVMFFLQRTFRYHQHAVPAEIGDSNCTTHPAPSGGRQVSWIAVAVGLGFHSLLDGLAIAAAVAAEAGATVGWVGLGTTLAVILHKPFDAFTVLTLMHSSACGPGLKRAMNVGIALVTPVAVGLASLGLGSMAEANGALLGYGLALCAGGFLCIACSDLLPELHFHSHDCLRLSLALLAGSGRIYFRGGIRGPWPQPRS